MAKHNTWFRKLGKWFKSIFKDVPPIDQLLKNAIGGVTGTSMTDKEMQEADYQLQNQRILNDEEYMRKKEFYEIFESPAAQVRQYKSAGLNPALLYQGGASVSASGGIGTPGSADASSDNTSSALIAALLGFGQKIMQMQQDFKLREFDNDTRRIQTLNYGRYLDSLTRGKDLENSVFLEVFDLNKRRTEQDIKESMSRINLNDSSASLNDISNQRLFSLMENDAVQRRLMESGIKVNNSVAACNVVNKAILAAQSKYADRYYKALSDIQEFSASISSVESELYSKTKKERYDAAVAELKRIVVDAGMQEDIANSVAFQRSLEGKMTAKERAELWGSFARSVVGGLIAAGGIVASRMVAPSVTPFSYSPNSSMSYSPGTMY